ncbi:MULTISPECIES: ABC transporter permease [unclassified Candidatus Frackibacter]|uniref:ABC transporter permease n=1 Tax=unclassified Candidatus Frackibacter TaxID=2648818 RepID=UPI0007977013|nr:MULTISPECIES: ABC transporter permease [unclassified Candidatus Frackibacter]KXS43257.1 MAG: ABC-type antimicrobial peptide transport system, permease component [Candidatus Frackibacter sp. T328-2]SDC87760.1 putative ABC transport system permease protein [Candidatus Frackibacter sp. WG11]SEN01890.1 putative ABC transport system permease protein [Candidatus Frackibacter sp. WG12]SFM10076.1 putative ABC transport system permease protein [Candidatus Frackibacter sp. WG13]
MIFEIIIIALNSLKANKLRTFLSMLGIIIGVGAVIAIVSIGTGTQQRITARISNLGSNLINIRRGYRWGRSGVSSTATNVFTLEMAEYIEKSCPDVKVVLPNNQGSGLLIKGENNIQATVVGTEAAYQEIYDYYPRQGKFIGPDDLKEANNIIVLGSELVNELSPDSNPLGKSIKFNYQNRTLLFTVVGVMEDKSTGGPVGDLNSQAYIPSTTYMNKLANSNYVSGFTAQARSSEVASEAVDQIEYFLIKAIGDKDGFHIMSQDQILDTINDVTNSMTLMLGGIAAISLLVGGIGIMNIMLVSVTERTKEVGIRKALGAKKKDILTQFLIESLALSGIGGVLGIGLGYIGAYLIAQFAGWPFVVSNLSVIVAFSFSLLIGIFFGIYPAMKAAALDPVDALSYE